MSLKYKCPDQILQTTLKLIFLGCWGTYCKGGEQTIPVFKDKKVPDVKDVIYGEKYVAKSIELYTNEYEPVNAVILAGDNVYKEPIDKDIVAEKIKKLKLKRAEIASKIKTQYGRSAEDYLPPELEHQVKREFQSELFNIDEQLSTGFTECMANVNTDIFLVGVGNHDIENCNILQAQLDFSKPGNKWYFPKEYYKYSYALPGCNVNLIFIDTNIYEGHPTQCSQCSTCHIPDKSTTNEQLIDEQEAWLHSILTDSEYNTWNIVIGHIPFYCRAHKDYAILNNSGLRDLMMKNYRKIDLYMCADEHNQQYIPADPCLKIPPQVIVGSGGAPLDEPSNSPIIPKSWGWWAQRTFGFSTINIDQDKIAIKYHGKNPELLAQLFEISPMASVEEYLHLPNSNKNYIIEKKESLLELEQGPDLSQFAAIQNDDVFNISPEDFLRLQLQENLSTRESEPFFYFTDPLSSLRKQIVSRY